MAFVANRGTQSSVVDDNDYTLTPTDDLTAGNIWLLSIGHKRTGGSTVAALSVSGRGLTWTSVENQVSATGTTMTEVWIGIGTDSGSGGITVSYLSNQTCHMMHLFEWDNVDTADPIVQTADEASAGNVPTQSCSFTDPPTSGMSFGAVSNTFPNNHAADSPWVELEDTVTTPDNMGLMSFRDDTNDQSVVISTSPDSPMNVILVELRAVSAPAADEPPLPFRRSLPYTISSTFQSLSLSPEFLDALQLPLPFRPLTFNERYYTQFHKPYSLSLFTDALIIEAPAVPDDPPIRRLTHYRLPYRTITFPDQHKRIPLQVLAPEPAPLRLLPLRSRVLWYALRQRGGRRWVPVTLTVPPITSIPSLDHDALYFPLTSPTSYHFLVTVHYYDFVISSPSGFRFQPNKDNRG